LYRRLCRARPGTAAAEGWPPPREEYVREQAREQRLAKEKRQRAEESSQANRAAQASRSARDLEAKFGPVLDAMTDGEAEQLVAGKPFLIAELRRRGVRSPLNRELLLFAISETETMVTQ
jgi:hypothetical protein